MRAAFFGCILVLLTLLAVNPARAFLDDGAYSDAERAGFAFYSLSKTKPDFESWVLDSKIYKSATVERRADILSEEIDRLGRGFRDFHPDEDLITLRVPVILSFPEIDKNTPVGQPVTVGVEFEDEGNIHFPVTQGGTWFALVPDDAKLVSGIRLENAAQYESFIKKGAFQNMRRRGAYAVAEMKLRAVAADAVTPVQMKDKSMWPVLVQIGSVMIYSESNSALVYMSAAPWYMNTKQQGLMNLYGN